MHHLIQAPDYSICTIYQIFSLKIRKDVFNSRPLVVTYFPRCIIHVNRSQQCFNAAPDPDLDFHFNADPNQGS
jgi:hypothetical protein